MLQTTAAKEVGNVADLALALCRARRAFIEYPCRVPDGEACRMQIHFVVRQHKTHTFGIAQSLAEGLQVPSILGGDVTRARRRRSTKCNVFDVRV